MFEKNNIRIRLARASIYLEDVVKLCDELKENIKDEIALENLQSDKSLCSRAKECLEVVAERLLKLKLLKFWEKHFEVR